VCARTRFWWQSPSLPLGAVLRGLGCGLRHGCPTFPYVSLPFSFCSPSLASCVRESKGRRLQPVAMEKTPVFCNSSFSLAATAKRKGREGEGLFGAGRAASSSARIRAVGTRGCDRRHLLSSSAGIGKGEGERGEPKTAVTRRWSEKKGSLSRIKRRATVHQRGGSEDFY